MFDVIVVEGIACILFGTYLAWARRWPGLVAFGWSRSDWRNWKQEATFSDQYLVGGFRLFGLGLVATGFVILATGRHF